MYLYLEALNIQDVLYHCNAVFKYTGYETGTIIIPILRMSKLVRLSNLLKVTARKCELGDFKMTSFISVIGQQ